MADAPGPLDIVCRVFEKAGVEAVLIGAQAVNMWAEQRATFDVDIIVRQPSPGRIEQALADLRERGFHVQPRPPHSARPSGPDSAVVYDPVNDVAFDIHTAKTDYQDEIIRRARRFDASQPFPVATPEDLIVLKLIANRHKDQRDLIELAALPGLDWDYVERWATEWGVEKLLAALRGWDGQT